MTFLRFACAALAALCATLVVAAPARFDFDTTPGRLSKDVVPSHYGLTLDLDPEATTFGGTVVIAVRVRKPAPAIVLHAHQLEALSAALIGAGGERRLDVVADQAAQLWRLQPADGKPIEAGEQRLRIAYRGSVHEDGTGLFQAAHSVGGRPERMLATQLQAVYARSLFPAFDEPAFRAVFELAVRAPPGWQVLSNMPQQGQAEAGGAQLLRFAPTPPMPSYLVAVAVGHFEALDGSAGGVPLRILTVPGKRAQGAYALGVMQQILPYYNAYFGVPYALPKLDLLAVPSGRQGAMEDWGLISYAEGNLLFDPARSGPRTRRIVFNIVAHEVAHQWFGDLVTASSWEEIWLNEAFATWMADKAVDRFNPEWQARLRQRQPTDWTMARDAGPATRAIRSGAVLEESVFDVFDEITYIKGGAVLGMIEAWIGADAFQRGLAAYMRDRAFSNATAADLWLHIGEASGRDVAALAATWTDQPGFPLVTVASRCEAGQTVVELSQRRFSSAGTSDATRWKIPVVMQRGAERRTLLLEGERQSLELPGCSAEPLLLNPDGEGFYRVVYPASQRAALARDFAGLTPRVRSTLLSDTFALAQAGELPMTAFLDLLAAIPGVQGPGRLALFAQARFGLEFLDEAFFGHPEQAALRAAARALLGPELASLGWAPRPGESEEAEDLRGALIRELARFDDPEAIARANALFDADEAGTTALPAGIREAVVRAAGAHADGPRFERLLARLKRSESEEEKWILTSALASTRDPAQADRVLALALDGSVPANIAAHLPGMVSEQRWHAEAAYRYTLDHWPALARMAGSMFGLRDRLLPSAAEGFNDRDRALQLLADQSRLDGETGAATAKTAAARIEWLSEVRQREGARLVEPLRTLAARLASPPR